MAEHQDRPQAPQPVQADRAVFIKLGERGCWESQCLDSGTLRFGYAEISHTQCEQRNWDAVGRDALENLRKGDSGAAKRDVTQIRTFYEADARVLWITFHADRLWWCFSDPQVSVLPGNEKLRKVIGAWSDRDMRGGLLLKSKLSGKLLAVQKFRGTICAVRERSYLLHKINGTAEPHVAAAQAASENLQKALIPIIKNLHEKDLEVLVDLVFRQEGWQRVGVSGGTERDIDLDLVSPVTDERIAVQVKSRADAAVWRTCRDTFERMYGFSRFYFVTHSPEDDLPEAVANAANPALVLWDAEKLALMSMRGGLTGWLLDKAS